MSYAQPSDMLARYDARRLGDLVQDGGTRVSSSALLSDPNLQAALNDASGMIDGALQRGQRYAAADLTSLTGNAQSLLIRVCCDLAYGLLVGRRAYSAEDTAAQAPRYAEAMRLLQMLEDGEWIFPTQGALAAGVPVPAVQLSQNIGLISSITQIFGDLSVWPQQNYPLYSSFDRE